jgi:hypothetical protein
MAASNHDYIVGTVSQSVACPCLDRTFDPTYATVDSETVANERRTSMADRTRGAWPQSMRALEDTASTMATHG